MGTAALRPAGEAGETPAYGPALAACRHEGHDGRILDPPLLPLPCEGHDNRPRHEQEGREYGGEDRQAPEDALHRSPSAIVMDERKRLGSWA